MCFIWNLLFVMNPNICLWCTPFHYALHHYLFEVFSFWHVPFLECAIFWNVLVLECAVFGICCFWNVLFLECAVFGMCIFLECAVFGMCFFWNSNTYFCLYGIYIVQNYNPIVYNSCINSLDGTQFVAFRSVWVLHWTVPIPTFNYCAPKIQNWEHHATCEQNQASSFTFTS